ncbi:unnamed protein product [Rotaria sp. Silwood1]|nr:unnamed protein product [Rotaria sp. Silwood1]CAF1414778.1 unnamed protein product [Rotaria sp. Silwood1]CAF3560351.1 unnamed protein product [Rotaria sp. Silwood1]CAF3620318.1 unnamed protein product [Rotaria sp. Silwood1]CAF3648356.1 unnamed protein product [Rotaria sp. Silwood1]
MHITHENLLKYRGIALEYDHILFFMEYCSHGTIAQLLLGTSSSSSSLHIDTRCLSASLVYSLNHTSSVDKDIIQITADFVFF